MSIRLIILAIVIAGGWWYYNGPWQAQRHPDYDTRKAQLQEDIRNCILAKERKLSMTGKSEGVPEEVCSEQYNAYRAENGQWHSYDETRQ